MSILHDKEYGIPLEPPRVVVRFQEGVGFVEEDNLDGLVEFVKERLGEGFPELTISPVFPPSERGLLAELVQRAAYLDPTYRPVDFAAFAYVDAPPGTDQVALVKALLSWDEVQEAYIAQVGPDPAVQAADDPRASLQAHLDPAPVGIDARYAWTFAGGDGAGQRFVDLERGWVLDHEDLSDHGAALLHGIVLNASRAHGTAVLGIVCAVDNTVGTVGIAPKVASVRVASLHGSTLSEALLAAVANLAAGDTLLVEVQVGLNGTSLYGPIEAYAVEWELSRLATALGIVVVEAGGNGTGNGAVPALEMDLYTSLSGLAVLRRDDAQAGAFDSGAIIVTAATSGEEHARLDYAPHGQRIDCFAWGENIHTLSSTTANPKAAYMNTFDGTSGATAIVAGAALAVQGRAQALRGSPLSPLALRDILSDPMPGFNTPAAAGETTHIGVMPNLRSIFNRLMIDLP